ncbi:MAG: RNA methyltransferase [Ginsengibacter sp.]
MLSKAAAKYIQSLHHKKFRDEEDLLIAEGVKVLHDIISSKKFECRLLYATADWFDEHEQLLEGLTSTQKIVASEDELTKISTLHTPNKVLGVFKQPKSAEIVLENNISLMLDDISDPGNMGTLIRIADWFGIENIICSEHCVEVYNPKVVQATMGSICRVNVMYTSLPAFIQNNRAIPTYAASLRGESLSTLDSTTEGILIVGNESKGISNDVLDLSTKKITIPKYGQAESLNAAVATGIILSWMKEA